MDLESGDFMMRFIVWGLAKVVKKTISFWGDFIKVWSCLGRGFDACPPLDLQRQGCLSSMLLRGHSTKSYADSRSAVPTALESFVGSCPRVKNAFGAASRSGLQDRPCLRHFYKNETACLQRGKLCVYSWCKGDIRSGDVE